MFLSGCDRTRKEREARFEQGDVGSDVAKAYQNVSDQIQKLFNFLPRGELLRVASGGDEVMMATVLVRDGGGNSQRSKLEIKLFVEDKNPED